MRLERLFPRLLALVLCLAAACAAPAGDGPRPDAGEPLALDVTLPIGAPLVVGEDVVVPAGDYLRASRGDEGVILLEGLRGVTLDLRGVRLSGAPLGSAPDEGAGRGVVVRGCEDVRVLGGHLSGYRVGLWIENSTGVRVEGLTVDPTFGPHLSLTTAQRIEPARLGDALERFGAAIAVLDCSDVRVEGCRARGGAVGLLARRSDGCRFVDNDFSFLSAFGLVLDASHGCEVLGNRCDAVTRSAERGQEDHGATGLLLTGGASDNLVAGNRARACCAGGRSLGGGRNRWAYNDLSRGSCYGLLLVGGAEDWVLGNRVVDGAGAGFATQDATDVVLVDNRVESLYGAGLRVVGGRRAVVSANRLTDCDGGLEVRGEGVELAHWFGQNRFRQNIQDVVLEEALGLQFWQNDFDQTRPLVHLDGLAAEGQDDLEPRAVWAWLKDSEQHLPSGRSTRSGLRWAAPQPPIVLARVSGWRAPAGHSAVPESADGPAEIVLGEFAPWDPAGGAPRPDGQRARGLLAGARWQAAWFPWQRESDPRGDLDRWRSGRYTATVRADVGAWSDPWGGDAEVRRSLPATNFGLMASCTVEVAQPGTYVLGVRADDGVRLAVDGEVVLEDWTWHPARRTSREIELSVGIHRLELEYFQLDGAAVLELELEAPSRP